MSPKHSLHSTPPKVTNLKYLAIKILEHLLILYNYLVDFLELITYSRKNKSIRKDQKAGTETPAIKPETVTGNESEEQPETRY